jgi:hypothetical protein
MKARMNYVIDHATRSRDASTAAAVVINTVIADLLCAECRKNHRENFPMNAEKFLF